MTDLWSFLLQTLTASGVAALLLVIKALLQDKLSPRWQFDIWGILGLVLLIPAGSGRRYVLVNWPLLVETAKTLLVGDYSLTRVLAPIPLLPDHLPTQLTDWLYLIYWAGFLILLIRYAVNYLRLRQILRRGTPTGEALTARIHEVAQQYGLPSCRAVEVPGLTSAFVCGLIHPVIALPADVPVDDKVLLHELYHRKNRDVGWGLVICLFRCIHWCNPFLWYCADRAANDLESRCDQYVLEALSGEERREYGRILLSMTDERYARMPGTSSMANGSQNIRRRIEAIAWFKKYPSGMGLVSVCIAIILAPSLLLGTGSQSYREYTGIYSRLTVSVNMASARVSLCTTPAGAADTYAKSVLTQNSYYRAMYAPLSDQADLADSLLQKKEQHLLPLWDTGLPSWPDSQSGYFIYNLRLTEEDRYEGLLAVKLITPPDGQIIEEGITYLAVQIIQIEKEGSRWVVIPQEDFRTVRITADKLQWGCQDLPSCRYEAQAGDFLLQLDYQKIFFIDSYMQTDSIFAWSSYLSYDTTPQPDGTFTVYSHETLTAFYTGDPADAEDLTSIGASCTEMSADGAWPAFSGIGPNQLDSTGSGSNGSFWGYWTWETDWNTGAAIFLAGEGSGRSSETEDYTMPEAFAAKFYLNDQKTAELTLLPVKGGPEP